jgi:hypothetical protein
MRKAAWIGLLLGVLGCGEPAGPAEPHAKSSPSPEQIVYEQLRSGSVQLDSAVQILSEALETVNAKTLPRDEAIDEMRDLIDGAGASISDLSAPPSGIAEVKAKFAEYDDHRLKAVESANDALHAIADAFEITEGLRETPAFSKVAELEDLSDLLKEAKQNLRDAIITLGGKVELSGA